ncbi:MAG: sugar phosphate nucleotidyltransferase [Candidatus Kapaibacterium sp.]
MQNAKDGQYAPGWKLMHAIIPVAGFGTRLRPHTYSLPKVLLNVAGKPILAHIIDGLLVDGITSLTIVTGYLGDAVREFMRARYSELLVNFVEQAEPLGLGHAIWIAREDIPTDGSPFLIALGDTIFEADLQSVLRGKTSAIGVYEVEDPRRFGVVEAEGGFATKLVEKPEHPKSNLMIAGPYYFKNPSLLRTCLDELVANDRRTKNEYQLTDALQMMIERGEKFAIFPLQGWYDCGKPETLLSTNRALLDKHSQSRAMPNTIIHEPVFLAEEADIENAILGPYATIGAGTHVRNAIIRDCIIGDQAQIEGVLLEASIVGNNAKIQGPFYHINTGDSSEIDLR